MADWNSCEHEWEEVEGCMLDPKRTTVECKKCGCPGEQWVETGEVDWPCT